MALNRLVLFVAQFGDNIEISLGWNEILLFEILQCCGQAFL